MADPWLNAAAVRARRPRVKSSSDAEIPSLVARFEDIAERYIGCAQVPRTATYTGYPVDGWLELPNVLVSAVTVQDRDGHTVTVSQTDSERGRVLVNTASCYPLTAAYTHGAAAPSELLLSDCAFYVERMLLVDATASSRDTLSRAFEGGSERYSTPNWDEGRPTGFLQIDADLNSMRNYRPVLF